MSRSSFSITPSGKFERVIVLWHFFRVIYSEDENTSPFDDNTKDILELHSLMIPCATVMRESQRSSELTVGKMHSFVALRMASTFGPDKPLKVRRVKGCSEACSGELRSAVSSSTNCRE